MRPLIVFLLVFLFSGCIKGNIETGSSTAIIMKNETGADMERIITKADYLEIGKIVKEPVTGQKKLEINGSTRFRVKVGADSTVESPYTKTKCVYYTASAYDESDPNVSVFIETLSDIGEEFVISINGKLVRPDNIKLEPYKDKDAKFIYSLEPIETKDGNNVMREYCLVQGEEYWLEIFYFTSALPPDKDGDVEYVESYHFYFSNRIYDKEKKKFVE